MRYFIISDVHSYYTLMINALRDKGFDETNPEHKIILDGDAFDRGNESKEMFSWLKDMIAKDKLIYIRGNHEDLLLELLIKGKPEMHDITNGTYSTIMQLGDSPVGQDRDALLKDKIYYMDLFDDLHEQYPEYKKALEKVKLSGIAEFIENNSIPYFETEHYIITHGGLPQGKKDLKLVSDLTWERARWVNGVQVFLRSRLKRGKTLVVGHWHCNWYRDRNKPEEEKWKDFSIEHITKKNGDDIYAIDACTAFSDQVNVLVIED